MDKIKIEIYAKFLHEEYNNEDEIKTAIIKQLEDIYISINSIEIQETYFSD